MSMQLFLLTRQDDVDYDQVMGMVVAAVDGRHARTVAGDQAADEGGAVWRSPGKSRLTCIAQSSAYLTPQVVLQDLLYG